jgi:hypothetical protein
MIAVVDTNVLLVANGQHEEMSPQSILERLLSQTQSQLRVSGPMEGVILRPLEAGHPVRVAKLVSPDFTQSIEVHWTKGELVKNRVMYA